MYKCGRQALTQRNKYIFKRKRIILDGALIVVDLVVTFQRIDLNVRTFQEIDFRLIQPLNITLVKITYLGQRPKIASLTDYSLLLEHYSRNAGGLITKIQKLLSI